MGLAGFTAGQADQLRRAMSRKRSRKAMLPAGAAPSTATPSALEGARAAASPDGGASLPSARGIDVPAAEGRLEPDECSAADFRAVAAAAHTYR